MTDKKYVLIPVNDDHNGLNHAEAEFHTVHSDGTVTVEFRNEITITEKGHAALNDARQEDKGK